MAFITKTISIKPNLTVISLDDWIGIYKEGKLLLQGHSIDYYELLEKLGYNVDSKYIPNDDLDEFGNQLPEQLSEITEYINSKK